MEKIISFQNIEVAPYIVEQLLDVRIDQQMNEHGTFYFKALLPEEKKDSYVINNSQGSNVSLSVRETDGNRDGSYIRDKAMMNRTDCKVGIDKNIPPFGACRSETKDGIDIKIEDTKDLLQVTDEDGNPVEVPLPIEGKLCEPELAKEWADAQEETLVDGEPALTVKCTITCKYGGVIGFMDAGQGVY